jgi:hypothetical protein
MYPNQLVNLASEMTIVGGEIAYDAGTNPVVSVPPADNNSGVPECFQLMQNYPNPFNPATQISFQIAERADVLLRVFDPLGREVATLVNEKMTPGYYTRVFDGSELASGVYLYRLQANGYVQTKKLLLTK